MWQMKRGDKVGKKHFFYPTIIAGIIGCVVIWSAKFFVGKNLKAELAILIVGGILVICVTLVMAGLFTASYRDCIPKGREGLFQGCRMVLYVLVPMIIGPLIAQLLSISIIKALQTARKLCIPWSCSWAPPRSWCSALFLPLLCAKSRTRYMKNCWKK